MLLKCALFVTIGNQMPEADVCWNEELEAGACNTSSDDAQWRPRDDQTRVFKHRNKNDAIRAHNQAKLADYVEADYFPRRNRLREQSNEIIDRNNVALERLEYDKAFHGHSERAILVLFSIYYLIVILIIARVANSMLVRGVLFARGHRGKSFGALGASIVFLAAPLVMKNAARGLYDAWAAVPLAMKEFGLLPEVYDHTLREGGVQRAAPRKYVDAQREIIHDVDSTQCFAKRGRFGKYASIPRPDDDAGWYAFEAPYMNEMRRNNPQMHPTKLSADERAGVYASNANYRTTCREASEVEVLKDKDVYFCWGTADQCNHYAPLDPLFPGSDNMCEKSEYEFLCEKPNEQKDITS